MEAFLDSMQWPAMVFTVLAAWLMASSSPRKRHWGFAIFLVSNVCWAVWGYHDEAYAVIVLQFCLAALNIRGLVKTKEQGTGKAG
jgi:hypothetical protein